jgi:hypothetical protein
MMGRVMLMKKVTRMAEMEGEKAQAAQLSSQEPLAGIVLRSGCVLIVARGC